MGIMSELANISEWEVKRLREEALTKLYASGATMLLPDRNLGHMMHAPVSLFPKKLEKSIFDLAIKLAVPYNSLVDRVARRPSWLYRTLKPTAGADAFTDNCLKMMVEVLNISDDEERKLLENDPETIIAVDSRMTQLPQKLMLGIFRSDYMVEESDSREPGASSSDWKLRQIELNTIASSFGALSTKVSELHSHLSDILRVSRGSFAPTSSYYYFPSVHPADVSGSVPVDTSIEESWQASQRGPLVSSSLSSIARGLAAAHASYLSSRPGGASPQREVVVLMVVQPGERNIQDQRLIELELLQTHRVRTVRATLTQLQQVNRFMPQALRQDIQPLYLPPVLPELSFVTNPTENLSLTNNFVAGPVDDEIPLDQYLEVSVVYYRAGYSPDDYHFLSDDEWNARIFMEKSTAIKCPSVMYHLAGTKRVQQVLARPGVLEEVFSHPYLLSSSASPNTSSENLGPNNSASNEETIKLLRSSFAGLWTTDLVEANAQEKEGAKEAILDAKVHPERYVLKPQREGGGNNIYGEDVAHALSAVVLNPASGDLKIDEGVAGAQNTHKQPPLKASELAGFILMERVFPRVSDSIIVKNGESVLKGTVSEIGVYSVYLGDDQREIMSAAAGYLVRTKVEESDEGGVAAGYAVLDSLYLY